MPLDPLLDITPCN